MRLASNPCLNVTNHNRIIHLDQFSYKFIQVTKLHRKGFFRYISAEIPVKMSKRKRDLPKPKASFFDSPPSSPPPSAAGRKEPPDQKRQYFNSREPTDPEMMETKELWVAPQILFRRYGLNGFIQVLEFELFPSDTESYTVQQVSEIQHIIADLIANAVMTPIELVQRIANLTASASKDVRDTVGELAEQFAAIATEESQPQLEDAKLRF